MSTYKVAQLEEIEEITDGRCPWRPVRKHFGIMSFGINAWTAPNAGDRIINEHDEDGEHEELYIVQRGRATFELDGERIDAPAGTFVFADPGRSGRRSPRSRERRSSRWAGPRGRRSSRTAGRSGRQFTRCTSMGSTTRPPTAESG